MATETSTVLVHQPERFDISKLAQNAGKAILMLAAVGAIVPLAIVVPNLPAGIGVLARQFRRMPRDRLRKAMRRLQQQRLVEIADMPDGTQKVTVTRNGQERVMRFNFECLRLVSQPRWDQRWRIIAFDIPERLRRARFALRHKMNDLHFYPLQKSVFITPHPCRDEIEFIADYFGVGRFINYIEADHIDDAAFLKRHFGL